MLEALECHDEPTANDEKNRKSKQILWRSSHAHLLCYQGGRQILRNRVRFSAGPIGPSTPCILVLSSIDSASLGGALAVRSSPLPLLRSESNVGASAVLRGAAASPRAAAITERRQRLGDRLVILGHHYQVDEVVRHADLTGDSLKLSQLAAGVADEKPVEHVIFCGVHFMAESADMLTPEDVNVILPDLSAGCSMADMAAYDDTVEAWEHMHASLEIGRAS